MEEGKTGGVRRGRVEGKGSGGGELTACVCTHAFVYHCTNRLLVRTPWCSATRSNMPASISGEIWGVLIDEIRGDTATVHG